MRILAIDLGDVRTGLAVSDPTGTLTGEAWVITDRNHDRLAETILQAARERGVGHLVLGHPKNMDGTLGPRAEKSQAFQEKLAGLTDLPVTLWDERRTTWEAEGILINAGKRGKKKKETVDAVAASLILEGFLRRCANDT
ncbi:MAG: Holliday junction resolvase RuvX [Oscillospiraceae bacterium]|nr:Holliday junction resolvase RuvX [Oscillospiraceae bacterium]